MARKTSKQDENLDHLLDEKTVEGLADRLKTKLLPDLIQKIIRSSRDYRTAFAKSNVKRRSIICLGPTVYSMIPVHISGQSNIYSFKRLYKQFLIESP